MRAAILGVCLGHDPDQLRAYVRASTRLTHTDPRAEHGALLVALAAHHGAKHGPQGVRWETFFPEVRDAMGAMDDELQRLLAEVAKHLQQDAPAEKLAEALGLRRGVSGYVYHTVPLALYCWLRHPSDFRQAVEAVIDLGGDADSTGAIVGGLAGATVGARHSVRVDRRLAGMATISRLDDEAGRAPGRNIYRPGQPSRSRPPGTILARPRPTESVVFPDGGPAWFAASFTAVLRTAASGWRFPASPFRGGCSGLEHGYPASPRL
jgi:hypothetical protein